MVYCLIKKKNIALYQNGILPYEEKTLSYTKMVYCLMKKKHCLISKLYTAL